MPIAPSLRFSSPSGGSWDYQQGVRPMGYDVGDMVQLGNSLFPPLPGDLRLVFQTCHIPAILEPRFADGTPDTRWADLFLNDVPAPVFQNVRWKFRYVPPEETAFEYSYWTVAGPSSGVEYQIAEFIIKDVDNVSPPFGAQGWRLQDEFVATGPPWVTPGFSPTRIDSMLLAFWILGPQVPDGFEAEDLTPYTTTMNMEMRRQGGGSGANDGPIVVVATETWPTAEPAGTRSLTGPSDALHAAGCGLFEIRSPEAVLVESSMNVGEMDYGIVRWT